MTYQILNNGIAIKTLSAKGMNAIYNQFNSYAKKRKAVLREDKDAIGCLVWVLPAGNVLSLSRCN